MTARCRSTASQSPRAIGPVSSWGSSAASGVAPLTWATHGPTASSPATSAIARSGTHRRTSSGSASPRRTRRSASRALTVEPTRPCAPTIRMLSIILSLQFPSGIPGCRECSLGRLLHGKTRLEVRAHGRPVVVCDAVPGAVSVHAFADEYVLSVDSLEGRADRLERSARALVQRVGLELDPAAAPGLEGVSELEELGLAV